MESTCHSLGKVGGDGAKKHMLARRSTPRASTTGPPVLVGDMTEIMHPIEQVMEGILEELRQVLHNHITVSRLRGRQLSTWYQSNDFTKDSFIQRM